jgi:hypothetical protein
METKEMHFFKYLLLYLKIGVFFTTILLTYPDLSYCENKSTTYQANTIAIICDIKSKFPKNNEMINKRLNLDEVYDLVCEEITNTAFTLKQMVAQKIKYEPYKIIDRENITLLLKEKGYVISGIAKNTEARKLAKFAGADLLWLCKIRLISSKMPPFNEYDELSYSYVFKLIDVNSGVVKYMKSKNIKTPPKGDIHSAISHDLDNYVAKFMINYLEEVEGLVLVEE